MKFRIPHTVGWKMSKREVCQGYRVERRQPRPGMLQPLVGETSVSRSHAGSMLSTRKRSPFDLELGDGKPEIFVFQPYGLDADEVRELVKWCEDRGLECEVEACAWHAPTRPRADTTQEEAQPRPASSSTTRPRVEHQGPANRVHAQEVSVRCGGMSGARFETRVRLWKWELQKLADRTGLMITVCHMPSRRSKWNKIEHRLALLHHPELARQAARIARGKAPNDVWHVDLTAALRRRRASGCRPQRRSRPS